MLTYRCPISCLGKSALCIQPTYWDHTMLHVSLIQSLLLFRLLWQPIHCTLSDPVTQSFQSYAALEGHQNATASSSNMVTHCHDKERDNVLVATLTNISLDMSLCVTGHWPKLDPLSEERSVQFHCFNMVILRQTNHLCRLSGHGIYQVFPH